MATVHKFLPTASQFYKELQDRDNLANKRRHNRFHAVLLLQRMTRGYLIRKHIAWLSKNATVIQCAWRKFTARKLFRLALRWAVQEKHRKYYAKAATKIQALWRGYYSRKHKFCYRSYRRWLTTVTERGDKRAAEAAEFGIRTRADDLMILEEEARKWLAYVVFKLHHLLRTFHVAGIYSDPANTELTEFEKLLKSIQYLEYKKRLNRKYAEFVRKYKPQFTNKRLFPIIGEGNDYWYLSLPEMYELTSYGQPPPFDYYRHQDTHHSKIHKQPFLWKKARPPSQFEGRGPFSPPRSPKSPKAPAPTPVAVAAGDIAEPQKDPRFHLYVKYYRPRPDLIDYVDFHINVLLKRKCSIEQIELKDKRTRSCRSKNLQL